MQTTDTQTILRAVLSSLNEWDGSSDSAIEIIASNEPYYARLKSVEETDETLLELQKEIVMKQKQLMNHIQEERSKLKKQLEQVSKKGTVVNNYLAVKQSSAFVDRNF